MNRINYSVSLILCLTIYFVNQGESLSCYQCNSHDDRNCEDPPDSLKVQCPPPGQSRNYTLCRKIKQIIEFEVNGLPPDTRIIRSCGWDDSSYKNNCYQRSGFGGRQEVCACDTDNCNGALALSATAVPVVVGLVALMKLFM